MYAPCIEILGLDKGKHLVSGTASCYIVIGNSSVIESHACLTSFYTVTVTLVPTAMPLRLDALYLRAFSEFNIDYYSLANNHLQRITVVLMLRCFYLLFLYGYLYILYCCTCCNKS